MKSLLCFVLSLISYLSATDFSTSFTQVTVNVSTLGILRGRTGQTYFTGRSISKFYGINYALPPSGNRRFTNPVKFPTFGQVYDATRMRQQCPQIYSAYYPSPDPSELNVENDTEDCLIVNVFTPKLTPKKLMPVMFYIHGGSFYLGSAYEFQPEFLLEEDIVLVVPQYRLGVFGFLSFNTDQAPGNVGMLDILMALEWVQTHIHGFGGNKSHVTVVGHSAGAAAASSLLISPLVNKELFHGMILQSGSILSPWAFDGKALSSAEKIAEMAGCKSSDIRKVMDCLRKVPPLVLAEIHASYMEIDERSGGTGNGGRSLVRQRVHSGSYLTKNPHISDVNISIPIMAGVVRDEGSIFLADRYLVIRQQYEHDKSNAARKLTKDVLKLFNCSDPSEILTDAYQVIFFKQGQNQTFEEMLRGFSDVFGLLALKHPTFKFIQNDRHERVYLYSFDFLGNISKVRDSRPDWDQSYPFPPGVAHADEIGYLFPTKRSNYTKRELKMVKTMTRLWTNFVKNGYPSDNPQKYLMTGPYGPYLRISDKLEVRKDFFDEFTIATREGYASGAFSISPFAFGLVALLTSCLLNISTF